MFIKLLLLLLFTSIITSQYNVKYYYYQRPILLKITIKIKINFLIPNPINKTTKTHPPTSEIPTTKTTKISKITETTVMETPMEITMETTKDQIHPIQDKKTHKIEEVTPLDQETKKIMEDQAINKIHIKAIKEISGQEIKVIEDMETTSKEEVTKEIMVVKEAIKEAIKEVKEAIREVKDNMETPQCSQEIKTPEATI
jgi:hypothetical protein